MATAPALRPSTSSLTGPIGPHRVWSWASARLDAVKEVRSALGGTVNDVVLAIVTNGFRDLLIERGKEISPRRTVRTMVPVSVRTRSSRPGRRSPATPSRNCRGSRRRCCSRSEAAS